MAPERPAAAGRPDPPRPLRVVVTRPSAQAEPLVAALQAAGVPAVALPLIAIEPAADPLPLQQAWHELPRYALLMFVSANAVQHFMRLRPPSARWPAALLAGSTGPGTTAALHAAGVPAEQVVEPQGSTYDSEALWQRLSPRDWHGQRVLVVRGEGGRDWLAEQLQARGAAVDFIAAYRRCPPQPDAAGRAVLDAALAQPRQHLWSLSSSEAVAHLARLAPRADWTLARAAAPHARIAEALRRLGFGQVLQAPADAAALAALARQGAAEAAEAAGAPIQSAAP